MLTRGVGGQKIWFQVVGEVLLARDDVDLESKDDKGRRAYDMAKEYRDNLVALNSENVRERIRVLSDILRKFEEYDDQTISKQRTCDA